MADQPSVRAQVLHGRSFHLLYESAALLQEDEVFEVLLRARRCHFFGLPQQFVAQTPFVRELPLVKIKVLLESVLSCELVSIVIKVATVVRLDFHEDGFGLAPGQLVQDFLDNRSESRIVRRWRSEGPHSLFSVLDQALGIVRNYKLLVPRSSVQYLVNRRSFRLEAVVTTRPSEGGVFQDETFILSSEIVTAELDSAPQLCE